MTFVWGREDGLWTGWWRGREGGRERGVEGDELAEFTSVPGDYIVVVVRVGGVEPASVVILEAISGRVVVV
jgi:hypothetical protein